MKPIYTLILGVWLLGVLSCSTDDSSVTVPSTDLYFPPNNSDTWETTAAEDLNWDTSQLPDLLAFLEEKNSKAFIILHQGKIVEEHYFNSHNSTTPWYWASAGKTLTAAVTGIAEAEGLIDLQSKVSDYLGTGWTNAPSNKEALITNEHLLQMTSGLDDGLGDGTSPSDLQYLEDAGQRWAYHNVYVKLQDVIATASLETWSNYFNGALKTKIGMSGAWLNGDDFNVYWSTARSMARFGLLSLANGNWNGEQIVPELFMYDATHATQTLNEAYGYLWWLNGSGTYRLPQTQYEFQGALIPNAPSDMFAALGKNDQKIYVIPSQELVIIRMGEAADEENFALSNFDNELWEKLNAFMN